MKMNVSTRVTANVAVAVFFCCSGPTVVADDRAWSVVPYFGFSQLDDQSASIRQSPEVAEEDIRVAVDSGFNAGIGIRYDYVNSPWVSELGWEYRSNDSIISTADGTNLPSGNYASNIFYLNGRYVLSRGGKLSSWVGGGVSWLQEADLDSEEGNTEQSFSGSGDVGFQLLAGADYALSERLFITGEIRYSSLSGLSLDEEGGNGRVRNIDYQPLTLGIGLGYRF